jgi:hypothetical protein
MQKLQYTAYLREDDFSTIGRRVTFSDYDPAKGNFDTISLSMTLPHIMNLDEPHTAKYLVTVELTPIMDVEN